MGKFMNALKRRARLWVQLCFTALTNGYAAGFAGGKIWRGNSKVLCLPGLNCYSCPGALGNCPIGSLQAVLADRNHKLAFYVAGFLILFGAFFGRFICGWLCPFGLVQDLLYKIPFVKKLKGLPGDRWLKYLKYTILAGFVIILPLTALDIVGQGSPWFCKYICPSGTLFAGIPLISANPALRSVLGWLFTWKFAILAVLVILSLLVYRPFCRYLCPLGAIYGLFNPVALYRYKIDAVKCTICGKCSHVCKLGIDVMRKPNSPDCIRCGECMKACPNGAITTAAKAAKRERTADKTQ